ncbi:hypothetical protein D3C76_1475640 [compost metagenome]
MGSSRYNCVNSQPLSCATPRTNSPNNAPPSAARDSPVNCSSKASAYSNGCFRSASIAPISDELADDTCIGTQRRMNMPKALTRGHRIEDTVGYSRQYMQFQQVVN